MKHLDSIIESGITFLLVFTPLAIGTTQQWSVSVMETAAFIIFGAWLIKMAVRPDLRPFRQKYILILLTAMISIVVLQVVPLPEHLLSLLSPSADRAYRTYMDNPNGEWRTISLHPAATLDELFKLLSYAAVFIVITEHFRTKEQVDRIVRTVIWAACFMVILAVAQKIMWNGRLFWFYPLRNGLNPLGPYINRNHFAGYMEMAIPLALGLLLYKASKIKLLPALSFKRKAAAFLGSRYFTPVALLSLAAVIMSSGVFFSLSRGGIIGFSTSMLFFTSLNRFKRGTGILAFLGAIILLFAISASWSRIEDRFGEIGEEGKIKRLDVWADTLLIVKDFPVFGTGLGTFNDIYPSYQTKNSTVLFEHAENDYIEILTDTGASGFIIFIGSAGLILHSVISKWRKRRNTFVRCIVTGGLSSCAAISVHSFTDFNLRIPANALLLSVVTAITYSAAYNVSDRRSSYTDTGANERRRPFAFAALAVLTLFIMSFPIRKLTADFYYNRAAQILDDKSTEYSDMLPISGDTMSSYREAIMSLKKSVAVDPSKAVYQKALSDIYSMLGRWAHTMEAASVPLPPDSYTSMDAYQKAAGCLRDAVNLQPTSPDYHLALGKLYDTMPDNGDLSDKELERALSAYPVNAPLRYEVAGQYLLAGRNGDALEQARILAKMDDSYIIPDSIEKRLMVESRPQWYVSRISQCWLFKAFEIAWRASAEDPEVVKGLAPDDLDAKEVLRIFFEWKGIEQ